MNLYKKIDNQCFSFNSSGLNLNLAEISPDDLGVIILKMACGIFSIFCLWRFVYNLLWWTIFQNWKIISKRSILRSISAHYFEDLIHANKLGGFIFKKYFLQRPEAFYTNPKPLIWASFFAQKLILYFF